MKLTHADKMCDLVTEYLESKDGSVESALDTTAWMVYLKGKKVTDGPTVRLLTSFVATSVMLAVADTVREFVQSVSGE